jgi:hypothetical protein
VCPTQKISGVADEVAVLFKHGSVYLPVGDSVLERLSLIDTAAARTRQDIILEWTAGLALW